MPSAAQYRKVCGGGVTAREAATKLGVSPDTVRAAACRYGLLLRRERQARGGVQVRKTDMRQTSIILPVDEFHALMQMAEARNVSVASIIRDYVTWGLETDLGEGAP